MGTEAGNPKFDPFGVVEESDRNGCWSGDHDTEWSVQVNDHNNPEGLAYLRERDRLNDLVRRDDGVWSAVRQTHPNEHRFVPMDVLWVRSRYADWSLRSFDNTIDEMSERLQRTYNICRHQIPLAAVAQHLGTYLDGPCELYNAVPYLIDPDTTFDVMSSVPPDLDVLADLRLPHRSVLVLLGAPFVLDADCGWWDPDWVDQFNRDHADHQHHTGCRKCGEHMDPSDQDVVVGIFKHGCTVHGVVLHAGPDGILDDKITWLVTSRGRHSPLPGRRSQAQMRSLIDNLAAAVAWGKWDPPPPRAAGLPNVFDSENLSRDDRKTLKKSAVKKAMRNDRYGVHVIMPRREWADTDNGDDEPSGPQRKTPRAHARRGHWRRQRVGGRQGEQGIDWHYEARWIHPVFVGGRPTNDRTVIYRVPSPDGMAIPEPPVERNTEESAA